MDNPVKARTSLHVPEYVINHPKYQDWKKFHVENLHVLKRILHEIQRGKEAGLKAISVKAIINALRWDHTVETCGAPYKINDAFTGLYTHVILANFPEYKLLLTSRNLKSKPKKVKR